MRLRRLKLLIGMLCVWSGVLYTSANAQVISTKPIKAGKEKLVLDLPKAEKWKATKVKKDLSSIRSWTYTSKRVDGVANPVISLETTTIDRRYFPVRARTTMDDKLQSVWRTDPHARLELVHELVMPNRYSVIFVIHPGEDNDAASLWIVQAVEGPTAFHSVEIQFSGENRNPDHLRDWTERLKRTRIK